ncbi:MAG: NAD(P)-binding protein [Rubrivivax sp.]
MNFSDRSFNAAVIGAGIAGAACAAGLRQAGVQVSVFDKARGVGGRMATRQVSWTAEGGESHMLQFDHGTQMFGARHPRFRALLAAAEAAGCVATFSPRIHQAVAVRAQSPQRVAVPTMPALCRHLLAELPLTLSHRVQRLDRKDAKWHLVADDGASTGPFDQVLIALPPSQAALLLAGHHDAWADVLAATPMHPCWTLMALTDDCEWPWDAAVPDRGVLSWIGRNDRKPQRQAPPGLATWVASASAEWSTAHIDDDPERVRTALAAELMRALPRFPVAPFLHHAAVHRWRYAMPALAPRSALTVPEPDAWWDGERGLGVCGDFLGGFPGGSDVEGAWRSGDELADTVAAFIDTEATEAEPA